MMDNATSGRANAQRVKTTPVDAARPAQCSGKADARIFETALSHV
jgi:hypothetical protein